MMSSIHDDEIRMGLLPRYLLLALNFAIAAPFLILVANMLNAAPIFAVPLGVWILAIVTFNTAHLMGSRIERVADGFVVRYLAFEDGTYFRWSDIGALRVAGFRPFRCVVFEGTPARRSRLWTFGSFVRRIPGSGDSRVQSLAGLTYGRSASSLLATLNGWRGGRHGV